MKIIQRYNRLSYSIVTNYKRRNTMFDTGNTGFMLVATSLVMLMTPGLAFFYGGLFLGKNVLPIMIQRFFFFVVLTALFLLLCFFFCFSCDPWGVVGKLH